MNQARTKRAAVEREREDIITALPTNVVDHIIELLPVRDAAKTSILSRKWRHVWCQHPYLVFSNSFCKSLTEQSEYVFKETVDVILLQHMGGIVKFHLDVSGLQLSSFTHIDRWVNYVTRNGVKKLLLNMSRNVTTTYKVPSYIFNCRTLTDLILLNCIFKPPNSVVGFNNLIILHLQRITFPPATEFCLINAPILVEFTLKHCVGSQYLNIVFSSELKYLSLYDSQYLNINCFKNCRNLTYLFLAVENTIRADERSKMEKLLFSLPSLETLSLGSSLLGLLSAGAVPKGLPFTMNNLWHLQLGVDLGQICQTSYALELMKSCSNLSKLQIWIRRGDNPETVLKYLDGAACLDQPLNKLKNVSVHLFKGSKAELLFVKLLFAHTPSLVRMNIKPARAFDSEQERNIIIELMRFPRASTKAELFYTPYSV